MTAALSWLVDLPWEAFALAGVVVTSFWTAVVVHRYEVRQRVQLDADWLKFVGRSS